MARSRSRSRRPAFLRHRTLVAIEALLMSSIVKDLVNELVKARPDVPNWGKVVFLMAATVGILGGLFVVLDKAATVSVSKTHEVAQALPLPAPVLVIHGAVFVGLFYLLAWEQGLPVWPMR